MKFKIILAIVIIFTISCNSKKESAESFSNELIIKKTEISNDTHIPVGNWILTKINRPWDRKPSFPKDEIWKISRSGEVIITKNDSLINKITCDFEYVVSGFSSDSIWVMKGNFNNQSIISDLEIWLKQNKMELIDQCDDCFSFEFERIE